MTTLETRPTDAPAAAPVWATDEAPRTVLITGAGSGLGRATAELLAGSGMRIVASDVVHDAARQTAEAIAASHGDAAWCPLDVRDPGEAESAVRFAVDRFGSLDVLINNAGTDVTAPFEELSVEDWDRVLDVNLRGPALLARAAMPALRRSGRGHIINITSTAAKRAWENAAAYHATKWGLLGLSHALHAEGRGEGIKVTAVVCGGMRTPFLLDRFPELDATWLLDPVRVAETIRFVLEQPADAVIPEIMVLPMRETSWP
jgi:NAD(P)-dependent dehydrogenase (short-subunit alcohol dehydrogenase family)